MKIQGGFFYRSALKMTELGYSDTYNFYDGIYFVIWHLVIFRVEQ